MPADFVARVFATMDAAHRHTFQVLTKRSGRLAALAPVLPWPSNVWAGVSVEAADCVHRIDDLRSFTAAVRFLSLGPLHGLDVTGIDWVIVGGESGPGARPVDPDWVREIRDHCLGAGVPFFFQQWGGARKKAAGRLLDGRMWDEMPSAKSQAGVAAAD